MPKSFIVVIEKRHSSNTQQAIKEAIEKWEEQAVDSNTPLSEVGEFEEINLYGTKVYKDFIAYHNDETAKDFRISLIESGKLSEVLDEADIPYQLIEIEYDSAPPFGIPAEQNSFAKKARNKAAIKTINETTVNN